MLSEYLDRARADRPLWMPELRAAFFSDPAARQVQMRLTKHDGKQADYPCAVPRWATEEERHIAAEYFYACVYNILAVCSGRKLELFFDITDGELCALYDSLERAFQLRETRRHGYGKVVSIASRIAASSSGEAFHFEKADLSAYTPLEEEKADRVSVPLEDKLRGVCKEASRLALCGIDVGGTDIKLALSLDGRLVCTKVFDWNPAAYQSAEELMEPIVVLTRFVRAFLHSARSDRAFPLTAEQLLDVGMRKDAPLSLMLDAALTAEKYCGESRLQLDGIGLSYPDIVIGDRILGGETPKTEGMRRNMALDYEREFHKLSGLKEELQKLCGPGGVVRITNDGNMAAFTAAMELAHSADAAALKDGVIAHSLGTDLGTGWLTAEGTIPALPLEMYDLILDLGSFPSRNIIPKDLRSTRNENSGLPGALRYMGQAAAYRLAYKQNSALLEGFTAWDGDALIIAMKPQDMRKPCLEQLMKLAEEGDEDACAVFRDIGENLSVITREMEYLLHPAPKSRFLFGRFVKRPKVFGLLDEGFHRGVRDISLVPSDEDLANTPLMRELAQSKDATVAQFGQAVGAVYYALTYGGKPNETQ